MTVGEKIAMWLKQNRMKQGTLATLSGLLPDKLTHLLRDQPRPSLEVLRKISLATRMSLDWLCDDEAEWPPVLIGGAVAPISKDQERILRLAEQVSVYDEVPSFMKTAEDRLLLREPRQALTGDISYSKPAEKPEEQPVRKPSKKSG